MHLHFERVCAHSGGGLCIGGEFYPCASTLVRKQLEFPSHAAQQPLSVSRIPTAASRQPHKHCRTPAAGIRLCGARARQTVAAHPLDGGVWGGHARQRNEITPIARRSPVVESPCQPLCLAPHARRLLLLLLLPRAHLMLDPRSS